MYIAALPARIAVLYSLCTAESFWQPGTQLDVAIRSSSNDILSTLDPPVDTRTNPHSIVFPPPPLPFARSFYTYNTLLLLLLLLLLFALHTVD